MAVLVISLLLAPITGISDTRGAAAGKNSSPLFKVSKAQMAENIENLAPVHPTVIFPVENEKAFCYTRAENIETETYLYHHWIRRDISITKVKLLLKPPAWSTFSSITLREADKGPWRVEITDLAGNVYQTLRFSVVD